jgi:Ca2+-binding RTX toxin-like protein
MTTFLYSELANGDTIEFDSRLDSLQVDTAGYSAADFSLTASADGTGIRFSNDSKQFTLLGTSLGGLSSDNITFSDGSKLVNAGVSNDYSSALTGTVHDDLLIGSHQQEIRLVATTADGVLSNGTENYPAVSADGRFVVFNSDASNLTGLPDNNGEDVFIKDLLTGTVVRVSENADGQDATDPDSGWASYDAVVSADGRFVAFQSYASNLVEGDTNGWADIFLKDLQTGEVTRVSTSTSGGQANTTGTSSGASISADGRYVAFVSGASNLVSGDTNAAPDVFVKDTVTGVLTRVSTTSNGGQANGGLYNYGSSDAQISADGRFVTFVSHSTNLVGGDDNGAYSSDIFVKNLQTGEIVCASTDSSGDFAYGEARNASISADGRYVVFESSADLLGDELNGHGSIYMRDMQTGTLTRVKAAGYEDYDFVQRPEISGNGRFVVFSTGAALVAGDTNEVADVYVKDVVTGEVALVSRGADGAYANDASSMAHISVDGSTIVFRNDGSGLTEDDPAYTDVFVVTNPLYSRTLSGGEGNDTYVVDNAADRVVEQANQGNDAVRSSISYALTANVERLVLSGSDAIDGTGNSLANRISGNGAANAINGGLGADTMLGGGGDDIYTVDNSGDVVTESAGGGTDSVRSSVSLVLSSEVENLTLSGSANLNGTGNASANRISGNAGNNILNGGAGSDTVTYFTATAGVTVDLSASGVQATGGAGNDTLLSFENLTGSAYADRLTGTAAANSLDGGVGIDTMNGGAGNDTYTVDNAGDLTLELADGGVDLVRSSVGFTLQANVEQLTLTGVAAISGTGNSLANTLTGNAALNTLTGGAGNDTLDGGVGQDTLSGGSGDDVYVVDNSGERTIEVAGGGIDTVQSSVSFALQAEVEKLTLTGSSAINGTGNGLANTLVGNGMANVLDGGSGVDTMTGGAGNDTYIVDNAADKLVEAAGDGSDLVKSSISLTLQAEFEKLTLTGGSAINGTGNSLANALTGNAAANTLNGAAGADTMTGGAGNDTYIVDNTGDQAIEVYGGGVDLVQSSVNFTLKAEVEKLTLTGTSAINGTGNSLANTITGNAAANVLNGAAGGDTMIGGAGDDIYVVDDWDDQIVETSGGGTDTVHSSNSFTLQSNVENLTLTGNWSVDGTGNALANVITGNSQSNVLDGGAGADTLTGGSGGDTYIVDNVGDKVVEAGGDGYYDSVLSSVSFTLQSELEELDLTGWAAINATGNSLDNIITGNDSANVINGAAGADVMIGRGGADTFAFTSPLASDLILDFETGIDQIRISQTAIRVGDGDTSVEGAVTISGPNGFATSAELVMVTDDIGGNIDISSASAAIGHADSAYKVGDTRLFIVDNGVDSAVYLFKSANADATVTANELTLVTTLDYAAYTVTTDYVFGA